MAFLRTKAVWGLPTHSITLGVRTLLAGHIELADPDRPPKEAAAAAIQRALDLEEAGADFIQLNPGPRRLRYDIPSATEELPRLVPVLRKLGLRLSVPIIVVTANALTAERAMGLGASVIHDVTGLAFDRGLASKMNGLNASLILGQMRGAPYQWPRQEPLTRLADHVRTDLQASLLRAHKAGIGRRKILVDPGLEHGKRGHENYRLLRSLQAVAPHNQGIHVNLAGKRFFVDSVQASAANRAAALAVVAVVAVEYGAHVITVERPAALVDTAAAIDRIYATGLPAG